jgi:hypothetical protein
MIGFILDTGMVLPLDFISINGYNTNYGNITDFGNHYLILAENKPKIKRNLPGIKIVASQNLKCENRFSD